MNNTSIIITWKPNNKMDLKLQHRDRNHPDFGTFFYAAKIVENVLFLESHSQPKTAIIFDSDQDFAKFLAQMSFHTDLFFIGL